MKQNHKQDDASLFKERSFAAIRRKKVLERVLKLALVIIAILMAIAVLFAYTSCTSDTAAVAPKTKVSVHVNDFSVEVSDFEGGATRAAVAPGSYNYVQALSLVFYNAEGKEVYNSFQIKEEGNANSTFGHFSFQLPVGDYTMVAIGREMGSNDVFSLTSPTQAGYESERARETFTAVQQVKITSAATVSLDVTLNRIIAKLVVISTDKQPAGVATIRTTYSAGSKRFNPTSGLATDNAGFVVTNSATTEGKQLSIKNFAFLTADEQSIDITLETLDADGKVLDTKVIPNVPFRRNRQTTLRGQLFTSTGTIHLNTDWLPEVEINF